MRVIKRFKIHLDNDKTKYFPGDKVTGRVVLDIKKYMKLIAIRIRIKGMCCVDLGREDAPPVKESYIDIRKSAYGKENAQNENARWLPRGEHIFPFTCHLPSDLPASFRAPSHAGKVCYKITATLVRSKRRNLKTSEELIIRGTLDLNKYPEQAKKWTGNSSMKTIGCSCFRTGTIEAEISVSKQGCVVGDEVQINAKVKNKSNARVRKTSVRLVQAVILKAKKETITETEHYVAGKVYGPGCPPRGSMKWTNKTLRIPDVPPTYLTDCVMIDVHYSIQFVAHLSLFRSNLKTSAPILVGTIPLKNTQKLPYIFPSSRVRRKLNDLTPVEEIPMSEVK